MTMPEIDLTLLDSLDDSAPCCECEDRATHWLKCPKCQHVFLYCDYHTHEIEGFKLYAFTRKVLLRCEKCKGHSSAHELVLHKL